MRVFLLTSFPSLQLEAPAPIGLEEVILRCSEHLSPSDMQELEAVCSTPPEGTSAFAREWHQAWTSIQIWNQAERRQRLPGSASAEASSTPDPDSRLRVDLEEAWSETNPLKRETALLRAEWNWLEQKRRAAPYSPDDLFGYALQLRLLERKDSWEETAGDTQFTSHVRSFVDPVLEELVAQESHA